MSENSVRLKFLVDNDEDRKVIIACLSKDFKVSEESRERTGAVQHLVCVEMELAQLAEMLR